MRPEGDTAAEEEEATDTLRREMRAEASGGQGLDVEIEEAAERYRIELKRAQEQGELARIRVALRHGAGGASG